MRTLSSVFRATSLELLKSLSIGGNSGNTHFVRCIRADLEYTPRAFKVCLIKKKYPFPFPLSKLNKFCLFFLSWYYID